MRTYALGNLELVVLVGGTVICAASVPAALPVWGMAFAAHYLIRRTTDIDQTIKRFIPTHLPTLLPPPDETPQSQDVMDDWLAVPAPTTQGETMADAVKRLPTLIHLREMRPLPQSPTALPLGVDSTGAHRWIDIQADALHIGLYGQTNAGKDTLLRCWFILLVKRNAPDRVQFMFLDAKGDWLTSNLAHLAHMWMPPAGGYGKTGDQAILTAIEAVDREAERRQQEITAAGCRTREQYERTTGQTMPVLIVVFTDVMSSIAGQAERLLESLVSKARALGIRVFVSMQTPSGKSQRWRMNLSVVLAGNVQDRSQDAPAMGLPEKALTYRPSQLPPSRKMPGVFVVRSDDLALVKAPFLSDDQFDTLVATLPHREDTSLLAGLLGIHDDGHTEGHRDEPDGHAVHVPDQDTACLRDVRDGTSVRDPPGPAEILAMIALLQQGTSVSVAAKKYRKMAGLPYDADDYHAHKARVEQVKQMLAHMNHSPDDDMDAPTNTDDDIPPPFRTGV